LPMEKILTEIARALARLEKQDWSLVGELISSSSRIFVAGAGRSGMIGRCFAIRLRHLGKESYVAGESICPPIGKGDTLVVISCSGKTRSTLGFAETAVRAGSRVLALTASLDSPLARLAQKAIFIPEGPSRQFAHSLFEQVAFLFLEACIERYRRARRIPTSRMARRHTNLE